MRRIAVLAALLVLVPAAAARATDPPPVVNSQATPSATQTSFQASLEQDVLTAINDVRLKYHLVPLRLNKQLSVAARSHSLSMAQDGYFRHESADGSPFWKRIKPLYPPRPRHTWGTGENMVWQSPDLSAAEAIDAWLNSPPHRKNLLTPSWREVGVGSVRALAAPGVYEGLDVTIVTADFGVR